METSIRLLKNILPIINCILVKYMVAVTSCDYKLCSIIMIISDVYLDVTRYIINYTSLTILDPNAKHLIGMSIP